MPWQMQFGSNGRDNASADYACCRFKAYLFRSDCDIALPGGKIEGAIFKRICWIITPIRYAHVCRRWGSRKTAPKETSRNTDFCYYIADRTHTRFIYACISTHMYIKPRRRRDSVRAESFMHARNLNIHTPLLYLSVDQVYLSLVFLSQHRPSLL